LNADGGFILVGGVTEKSPIHFREEVTELSWFRPELLNVRRYYDIINEWVYPSPEGIELMELRGEPSNQGKIICVLRIPKQLGGLRPFLIAKSISDEGGKVDSMLVGLSKRVFDGTNRLDKRDIHSLLQNGRLYEEKLTERLDSIVELLKRDRVKVQEQMIGYSAILPERIESAVAHLKVQGNRYLALSLFPIDPVNIPSIFESHRSPVAELMTKPPELRSSGWDVLCGLNPRIIEGKFLRNGESDRRVLDVYPDGTMVFVACINEDLLAWGSKTGSRLHPLALAESVWGACAFYKALMQLFDHSVESIKYQLHMRNLIACNLPTTLPPHQVGSMSFKYPMDDHSSDQDTMFSQGGFEVVTFTPEGAAFEILRSIYLWFGFSEQEMPYVTREDNQKSMDTAAMVRRSA